MTDLHCHLLPGIDDGAKNLEISLKLLEMDAASGVQRIALTSHFNPERQTLEEFVQARAQAFLTMYQAMKETDLAGKLEFKLASEVYFSPGLRELDMTPLCIGKTRFVLVEFPVTHRPFGLEETLYTLQERGFTPIVAHIERYSFVLENPAVLYEWVTSGFYIQINATTLLHGDKRLKRFLYQLIQWNLVHIIASDAHSPNRRPPNLAEGMALIRADLGDEMADRLIQNSEKIFAGWELDLPEIHCPRRRFGRWV